MIFSKKNNTHINTFFINFLLALFSFLLILNSAVAQNKKLGETAAELKRKQVKKSGSQVLINKLPIDAQGRLEQMPVTPAIENFKITDITVTGLSDIDPQTVFTYLPIKVNDEISEDKIQQAIQSLYSTGLFEDVSVSRNGTVLLVNVKERKVLGKLSITGTYEFNEDQLKESLRAVGLFEGKTYDPVLMSKAEQELKNQYLSRGFYSTKVVQEIAALDKKRIAVNLKVSEGQIAKIKSIKFFGNKLVSTSTLRGLMDSTDSTFISKNDRYSAQRLEADIERIAKYYLDNGFLDSQIDTAQVTISDDLNDIYISIGINEGEVYTLRSVELSNPLNSLTVEDFNKVNNLKVGSIYSQAEIDKVSNKLREILTRQGFVFPQINVEKIKSTTPNEKTVLLSFNLEENQRVTVNKITITGNTRTSDEVIRREFRLKEGDLFNSDSLANSRRQIERTDFFTDVQVYPQKVPGMPDKMDVIAKVVEKRTGSLNFGITSSNLHSIGFNASIKQNNWGGSGKQVGLSFNTAKSARALTATYYDPYFTDWGLGLGFNAFQQTDDSSSLSTGKYRNTSKGAGVRLNYNISDDVSIGAGLRGSVDSYTLYSDSPKVYKEQAAVYGYKPKDLVAHFSVDADFRDSPIYPMKGFYGRLYGEQTISKSDFQYKRLFLTMQGYLPITESVAIFLNTDIGKAYPSKNLPLPFSKYLYVGGTGSVRGYTYGTLGPYDITTDRYTGGDRSFNANLEILFPFPGATRSKEARLALFADTGMTWASGEKTNERKLRSSWGAALSWNSPIGPLRFSYAFPISKKPGDKLERFQFQIGTTF